jgi:hypothetical protein
MHAVVACRIGKATIVLGNDLKEVLRAQKGQDLEGPYLGNEQLCLDPLGAVRSLMRLHKRRDCLQSLFGSTEAAR